jgi:hypothetical protein
MSTSSRALLAAIVIAALFTGGRLVGGRATDAVAPPFDLKTMPMKIGDWSGRNPMPGEEFPDRPDDALSNVQRVYSAPGNHEVFAEVDTFAATGLVHPPEVCCRGSGAASIDSRSFTLHTASGDADARLLTFYQEGRRLHVLYWYQLGPNIFHDWPGFCRAKWSLGGEPHPLPLARVMIQIPGGLAGAETRLRTFAEPLLAWTQTIR